jgi:hypothetical protein
MKFISVIDLGKNRQVVENQIIEFWKRKGEDEDLTDIFDEIKFSLVGDDALSTDKLERSLNVLQNRTSISFEKGFDTGGSLLNVFCDYLSNESNGRIFGAIYYSRGFDLSLNHTLAKKIGRAGGMHFLHLFPAFHCSRSSTDPEKWYFSAGVVGDTIKCWESNEAVQDFGRALESKLLPSEHWKGAMFKWRKVEGGIGPIVSMRVNAHYGAAAIRNMLDEMEQSVIHKSGSFTELLTLFGDKDEEFYAKRAELINRLYRESALPADKIAFGLAASSIHELREVKDEVIGTVFEMLEFPLISSASKGVRFSAKRVFEGDRFLIRMKLAGKEAPCRALLKEMEEELGVEIKIESCK